MKTFQQFSNRNKKYVGVIFSEQTQKDLYKWATSNGFDLSIKYNGLPQKPTDFDFHTTVFFTTSEHDTKNGVFKVDEFTIQLVRFELLGKEKNIPVIVVDSDNLRNIRNVFEALGYQDEWPSYKPHISLSYNYKGTPDLSKLKLPDFDIVVTHFKVNDQ